MGGLDQKVDSKLGREKVLDSDFEQEDEGQLDKLG